MINHDHLLPGMLFRVNRRGSETIVSWVSGRTELIHYELPMGKSGRLFTDVCHITDLSPIPITPHILANWFGWPCENGRWIIGPEHFAHLKNDGRFVICLLSLQKWADVKLR